jgi:hypothetical protein
MSGIESYWCFTLEAGFRQRASFKRKSILADVILKFNQLQGCCMVAKIYRQIKYYWVMKNYKIRA